MTNTYRQLTVYDRRVIAFLDTTAVASYACMSGDATTLSLKEPQFQWVSILPLLLAAAIGCYETNWRTLQLLLYCISPPVCRAMQTSLSDKAMLLPFSGV